MEHAVNEAIEAIELDLPPQRFNDKGMVYCDICDKGFKNLSSRNKHLKTYYGGQYSCQHCGKLFTDGYVAVEEMETGTEAALPTLASSEAIGEVAEMVTEAQDMSGPALATEPRKKRGKGPKKAAEGESKEKDIAAMKVAPKKREESRCQERKESYGFCGGRG